MKPSEFVILTAVLASGIYTMLAKSGLAFFHITLIAVLAAIVFRMSAIHWRWHEIMPRGGSFVYFIFSFIDCLSSSPITGTKDPDHLSTVSKPYGPDAAARFPKTVVALLRFTVLKVFRDNAVRVRKSQLRKLECNTMLRLVLTILSLIPIEASRHNDAIKGYIQEDLK